MFIKMIFGSSRFNKRICGDYKRPINTYYLPSWDLNELITANHTDYNEETIGSELIQLIDYFCFLKYSLIQLERRYSICGGLARSVYSIVTENELKKDIIQTIYQSNIKQLRKFVDCEGNTSDPINHTLISLGVDHTLQTIRPVFASPFIIEQLNLID